MFVLSAPRTRVEVGIQLIGWVPLAPFRINILGAAARAVPHPTRAILGRVRHPIVQEPPNVFEAARPLQKVDTDRVIPRPLVHTLGGDASHVHRTVIDAHPRHVEQTAPLCAAEPKAEGDILILTPDARPALATLAQGARVPPQANPHDLRQDLLVLFIMNSRCSQSGCICSQIPCCKAGAKSPMQAKDWGEGCAQLAVPPAKQHRKK